MNRHNNNFGFSGLPSNNNGNNNNNNNRMMMSMYDPQLTQTSITLSQNTMLGLTPVSGDGQPQQQQQGRTRRLIVHEPSMERNDEILKSAIAKISKENAWSIPLPAAHPEFLIQDVLGEFGDASTDGASQQQNRGASSAAHGSAAGGAAGGGGSTDHFKKFTRAATFIENSSKVWVNRVDATYMLSQQMLSRLRSGQAAGGDGDGDGNADGTAGSPHNKNKKNKNRTLLRTIAETDAEINVENFDMKNAGQKGLRVTYGAMFAAMTQKFDQGFKGLLLNNAPIGREGNPYLDRDFARPEYAHLYNNGNSDEALYQQQQQHYNNNNNGTEATGGGGADELGGGVRVSGVLLKSLRNAAEDGSSPVRSSQQQHFAKQQQQSNPSSPSKYQDQLPPLVRGSPTSASSNIHNSDAASSSSLGMLNQSSISKVDDDYSQERDFQDDGMDNFDEGFDNNNNNISGIMNNGGDDDAGEDANPTHNNNRKSGGSNNGRFSFQANNKHAMQSHSTLSRAGSIANQLSRAQSVANDSLSKLQQEAFRDHNARNIWADAQELATGISHRHNNNDDDNNDDSAFYGNDNDDSAFYDDDDNNNNNNNNRLSTSTQFNNVNNGQVESFLNNSGRNNKKNQNLNGSVIALAAEDGAGGWQPLNTSTHSTGSNGNNNNNTSTTSSSHLRFANPAHGNAVLSTIRKGTKIGNSTEAILAGIDDVTKKAGAAAAALNMKASKNNNTSRRGRVHNDDDDDDDDRENDENEQQQLLTMMGLNSNNKTVAGSKKTTAFEASLNIDELRNFDQVFSAKLKAGRPGQHLLEMIPEAEKLRKDYTSATFTKNRSIEKKLLLPRASAADQEQLAWWFPRQTARDATSYYQPICAPEAHGWNLLSKYVTNDGTVTNKPGAGNGEVENFGDNDDFGAEDDFGGYDGDDDDVQQDEKFANGVFGGEDGLGENYADEHDGHHGDGFVNASDLLNDHNQQQQHSGGEGSGGRPSGSAHPNADLLKLIEPPATIDLGQFVIPAALVQINVVRLRACMWKHLERIASLETTAAHWQSILDHKDIQNDLRRDVAKDFREDDDEDSMPLIIPGRNAAGKRVAPITERSRAHHLPEPRQTRPACVFSEVVLGMLPEVPTFVRGGSLAPAFFFFSLLFLANEKALLMVPMRIGAKKNVGSTHCEDVLVLMPPIQ